MKFRVFDRIALVIGAIAGITVSLVFGFTIYTNDVPFRSFTLVWLFMCLLLLIGSLFSFRLAFRRGVKNKKSVSVQNTEQGNGEVRVSVQALETLIKQAIAGNSDGVADIKTSIDNFGGSISVQIEMSLNGDAHIPNVTMLLQSAIKGFVEEYAGIVVRDVSIMVKTIIPVMPQLAIAEKSTAAQSALNSGESNKVSAQVEVSQEPTQSPLPEESTHSATSEEPALEATEAQYESASEQVASDVEEDAMQDEQVDETSAVQCGPDDANCKEEEDTQEEARWKRGRIVCPISLESA